MQYTPHYNLNLPEGSDIVKPLIQDNPNYTAIDTALYNNKLRVVGTATHVKTGTNHAITLGDSDINQFKFVATGDYASGDTFTVDGVTVTARIADGSSIPSGAFKINSTVFAVLDGTILNILNITGTIDSSVVSYNNTGSGLASTNLQDAVDEIVGRIEVGQEIANLNALQMLNISVTFGKTFSAPPKVFMTINGSFVPGDEVDFPLVTTITTTGFTMRVKNNYSAPLSIPVDWVAIGY